MAKTGVKGLILGYTTAQYRWQGEFQIGYPDKHSTRIFWVGFNIVWSVLYERICWNALISTTHFQAASELAAAWNLRR